MLTKRQISIAFRDGINKLTGKDSLIEEYNLAVRALSHKTTSLQGTEKRKLLDQLKQIEEEEWVNEDPTSDIISIKSFNPYLIRSTKSKIKAKIAMLHQLMQEYNVK